MRRAVARDILLAFWKVHILHHAAEGPVVGQWMMQELRRHGYDVSPGTMYPLLARMQRNGWLRSEVDPGGGLRARRSYYLTAKGRAVLRIVRQQLDELRREVGGGGTEHQHAPRQGRRLPQRSGTTAGEASAAPQRSQRPTKSSRGRARAASTRRDHTE